MWIQQKCWTFKHLLRYKNRWSQERPNVFQVNFGSNPLSLSNEVRSDASSWSQWGPKAQFCPTFQKVWVLCDNIFGFSKSAGAAAAPPWTPQLRRPWTKYKTSKNESFNDQDAGGLQKIAWTLFLRPKTFTEPRTIIFLAMAITNVVRFFPWNWSLLCLKHISWNKILASLNLSNHNFSFSKTFSKIRIWQNSNYFLSGLSKLAKRINLTSLTSIGYNG